MASRTAIGLTDSTNSEPHLVHVGEFLSTFFAQTEIEPAQLEREARELLDEEAKRIEEASEKVAEIHLRTGEPDAEVISLGEEIGAGLIVVASRRLNLLKRLPVGSVSRSIVTHAHCSVLGARGEVKDTGHPVVQSPWPVCT